MSEFRNHIPAHARLHGASVLVTRARAQAGALVARIEALGGEAYAFPVITIAEPESWAPLDQALDCLKEYRWLVITSPNGASSLAARLRDRGAAPDSLAHLRVVAVGSATARALQEAGIQADLTPREFRGAALPELMGPRLQAGDRVLMARGDLADPALADQLTALGARVDDVVAYRTLLEGGNVAELKDLLQAGRITYVTFTSGSTVGNLVERLGGTHLLHSTRIAVIGPETKKAAEAAGLKVHVVAEQATVDSLIEALAHHWSHNR